MTAARPEIAKTTDALVSNGKFTVPGYHEKFGNLSEPPLLSFHTDLFRDDPSRMRLRWYILVLTDGLLIRRCHLEEGFSDSFMFHGKPCNKTVIFLLAR